MRYVKEASKYFQDEIRALEEKKEDPAAYGAAGGYHRMLMLDAAVFALEKQIELGMQEQGVCPVCFYDFGEGQVDYCPGCGQAIRQEEQDG